jgi:hypothetical protein
MQQMSKAHLILLCGMMVLPGRDCWGAEAPTLNAEQVKQVVLFAPKPYFPTRARKEYKTGAGVFLLNINPETGLVGSIKSRGQPGFGVLMSRV